jgi:hypothetical protein
MSIVCYPFIVTSCNPVNSSTIMYNMFFRQRFLLASTFLSSSLELKLAPVPSEGNLAGGLLQLRRKVFTRVVIIPALLPQMCVVTRHFCIFLGPVCHHTMISICLPSYISACRQLVHSQQATSEAQGNILSTGKSSNSSSSSNAAAGFASFVGSAFLSVAAALAALAAGAAPEAGAADMTVKVKVR